MFYGKANDEKHYQKVADSIRKINPRYQVSLGTRAAEGKNGTVTEVLEIRVAVSPSEVAFRFWVNPNDGCWVYREALMDSDGVWSDIWNDIVAWVGESDWNPPHFGSRQKPFMYTNFPKVTAHFFFAHGPLLAK